MNSNTVFHYDEVSFELVMDIWHVIEEDNIEQFKQLMLLNDEVLYNVEFTLNVIEKHLKKYPSNIAEYIEEIKLN